MVEGANRNARKRLEPGTVLNNNYRILQLIGEGGMGAVYRAANIFMEEDHVAVKVIRAEQADDDVFRQMFGKEVKAMLRLNNPRLVAYRTFAHDPDLDLSFIVTEFVDGPSLKSLIGKRRFAPQELIMVLTELAIGLRAAHKAGIVHRDIAPDNILLEDGDIDRPKIIDFGIVKDTAGDGTTIIGSGFAGKYNFVAPEQLGEPDYEIGPWTDIYSLGLVILGLANGQTIDMGNTPGAAIRTRRDVPDLTSLPAPFQPLLGAMLATHPDQRIRSAEEVLTRLGPVMEELDGRDSEAEDMAPTVVTAAAGTAAASLSGGPVGDTEPDDEVTQVVITETSRLQMAPEPEQAIGAGYDDADDDADDDYREEEQGTGGGGKLAWIALGLIAAAALAVFGGMMLGEFAGISRGEVKAVGSSQDPSSAPPATIPEPSPGDAGPTSPPDVLPVLGIATSLAPNSGVTAIDAGEWIRQDDLPRDLFRGESVSGVIAAYLTVASDGSVTGCTVGNSSEVSPERFLRPAAVGVCRALRERARFEPFVIEAPAPTPASTPAQTPAPTEGPATASPALQQQQTAAPQPEPELQLPVEPPVTEREVFVRVAFRTADEPAAEPAAR